MVTDNGGGTFVVWKEDYEDLINRPQDQQSIDKTNVKDIDSRDSPGKVLDIGGGGESDIALNS